MNEIEKITYIVTPIAEKYKIRSISLFGSRARGEDKDGSDYDFLISKGELNSLLLYVAFIEELEEAFGTHVDVVTDTSSDPHFLRSIEKDKVTLYER